jgi:hypothetical protein
MRQFSLPLRWLLDTLVFLLGLTLGPFGLTIALIRRSDQRGAEQLAQHREIVYLLRRGADERLDPVSQHEQLNAAGA